MYALLVLLSGTLIASWRRSMFFFISCIFFVIVFAFLVVVLVVILVANKERRPCHRKLFNLHLLYVLHLIFCFFALY